MSKTITPDQRIEIAARIGRGDNQEIIADALGVGISTVSSISKRLKRLVPGIGNPSPRERPARYWRDDDAEIGAPADLELPENRVKLYIASGGSPHTRRAYGACLRQAVDLLGLGGLGDLCSIDHGQAMRYMELLKAKGYAGSTINRQMTVLRYLLTREIRLGFRQPPNPLDTLLVKPPKGEARSTLDTLTPEEVQAVLKPCDEGEHVRHVRDAALLRVAFWCGLRVGELAGMTAARPDDWHHVREGAHFTHEDSGLVLYIVGKGEKARRMPVGDELAGKVQAYLEATGRDWTDTAPLWKPTRGRKCESMDPRSIRRLVQARCKQAGIRKRISTHSTRKTAATRLLALGVNVEDVRRYMGHTSIATTQRYFTENGEHPATRMHYDPEG